jgi:NAD(P)-dependent dehydrogenase (short-subunit alcohol dehydrogenase family)
VAIVTGAGRGLGRAHALHLAEQGAAVVVNDLGSDLQGLGSDQSPAHEVVEEIEAAGGHAVASGHDVADWNSAGELVRLAVETFGDLHVLVNNAGILRDRTLANMSREDWEHVIKVHLTGHAAPTRHALEHWRDRSKSGLPVHASVVMTSSIAGFAGNFGQANYSAAKLAVLALSRVVALEGARHGVRSNAVSPGARTRLSMTWSGATDEFGDVPDTGFDEHDPANVSPLIAWLAERDCPANAQVFHISGGEVLVLSMPPVVHRLHRDRRWTVEELEAELTPRLVRPPEVDDFLEQTDDR